MTKQIDQNVLLILMIVSNLMGYVVGGFYSSFNSFKVKNVIAFAIHYLKIQTPGLKWLVLT